MLMNKLLFAAEIYGRFTLGEVQQEMMKTALSKTTNHAHTLSFSV